MRWDSPFVLATAGTFAIHVLVLVAGDAVVVLNPSRPPPPAPHVEMFEIEVPPLVQPEPPKPVPEPEPEPTKAPEPPPTKVARTQTVRTPQRTAEPPPTKNEPPPVTDQPPTGGDQVVTLDDVPPSATGVGVAVGKRTSKHIGRGGTGGGTGSGTGSGASDGPPEPMSVATIKKRALPRGDYAYFAAGKDYPAEARQLGIEGPIRVRLVVDAQGKVKSAVLLNKLGHGLDELALRQANEIQFDPARDTDDRAVTSVVVWTFNMTLPK